jgi:uncharacterized membrane protein YedE/YeeE
MHHYTLWQALIGGILIGFASLLATVLSGKIPGISGVFGRLLVVAKPHSHSRRYGETDKTWRAIVNQRSEPSPSSSPSGRGEIRCNRLTI